MNISQKMLLCAAFLAASSPGPVSAHAVLEASTPAKDAVLTSMPDSVTLHFNEKLEPGFSSIQVVNAAGQNVVKAKAALDLADHTVLRANLDALKPGVYMVKWMAVGHDGHPRKGQYMFAVK